MRLTDKVALITGAASGIGKETALLFAQEGANIVAVDLNDSEGEKIVSEVKSAGGDAIYVNADVSKSNDCEKMEKLLRINMVSLMCCLTMQELWTAGMIMPRLRKRKFGI